MRRLGDVSTWILQRGHFVCPNVNEATHYLSELPIANCLLLRHLLSSLMLKGSGPEVVNGPNSRGSPPGDRREAETSRHRLEHDQ